MWGRDVGPSESGAFWLTFLRDLVARGLSGVMEADARPTLGPATTWPMTLRRVRAWLDPWTRLSRWWRAWTTAPPPPPAGQEATTPFAKLAALVDGE